MAQRRWTFLVRVLARLARGRHGADRRLDLLALSYIRSPESLPVGALIGAFVTAEGMSVLAAFLLAPATLASPLGGENQQGALDVLADRAGVGRQRYSRPGF